MPGIIVFNLLVPNETSINNPAFSTDMIISPNPFIDHVMIDFKQNLNNDVSLEIYDVLGRKVFADNALNFNKSKMMLEQSE
jgi:hypothetical protein